MIIQRHDIWWRHPYGGNLPICKRCGRPLYIEQWMTETCPGRRTSDIDYGEQDSR